MLPRCRVLLPWLVVAGITGAAPAAAVEPVVVLRGSEVSVLEDPLDELELARVQAERRQARIEAAPRTAAPAAPPSVIVVVVPLETIGVVTRPAYWAGWGVWRDRYHYGPQRWRGAVWKESHHFGRAHGRFTSRVKANAPFGSSKSSWSSRSGRR